MFKFFKYIKNQILLNQRLTDEEKQQRREGYSIKLMQEGSEQYIVYKENNREIIVFAGFTLLNDVQLHKNSYLSWSDFEGGKLTSLEYQRVQNRLIRYLSCWGGEVTVGD